MYIRSVLALCGGADQASSALWVENLGGRWKQEGNSLIFRSAWKAWLKPVAAVTFWGPLEKNCLGDICSLSTTVGRVNSKSPKATGAAEVICAFLGLWIGLRVTPRIPTLSDFGGVLLKQPLWIFFIVRERFNDQLNFRICFINILFYFQSMLKEGVE